MPQSFTVKMRRMISGGLAAAMLASAAAESAAAPLPVAPGQGAFSASSTLAAPTDVRFVRRRHARRFRGGDAAALAILGVGVAAVIAGSQHRRRRTYDDTYYDQGYDEGYDPGYYQPRRYYAPPQVYYPAPEYRVHQRRWRDEGDFDRGAGRHFERPQPPVVYNRPPPQPEFVQPRRHFDRPAVVHQEQRGVQQQENVGRTQYGAPSFCPPGQTCDVHR